mmetsp:Transcript_19926/g.50605  ORF Transcript_19926/g.50605 Transcript_19926/m.50605 type:complete len:635 (+) Transcript_19926:130-2034(+)|eukprot:CAMPEP_0177643818 /NCGR_PEP_ID=MMETSP0447-20121125/8350_1 /TAXON_ID=0 /ORGANISM="Stygamoeba regulata, Strain BSH-02190019" /LENGTH=634 /DNA_ID=CAMNT_0019146123 /DNA_START=63 /DNA_END=1970 /DNA_ORIENTATION=+
MSAFDDALKKVVLGENSKEESQQFIKTYKLHNNAEGMLSALMRIYMETKAEDTMASLQNKLVSFIEMWMSCEGSDFENTLVISKVLDLISRLSKDVDQFNKRSGANIQSMSLYKLKLKLIKIKKEKAEAFKAQQNAEADQNVAEGETEKMSVLSCGPVALAQALTMADLAHFTKVKGTEFLGNAWQKSNRFEAAPNLAALTDRFNSVSFWVATLILSTKSQTTQVEIVERFIDTALRLFKMNNYNSLMEVFSGLDMHAIQRLKGLWKRVSATSRERYSQLSMLMSPMNNYREYREHFSNILKKRSAKQGRMPVLPYVGLFLRDVTCASEGNVEEKGDVNLDKMKLIGQQIVLFQSCQECLYNFPIEPEVAALVAPSGHVMGEEELYQASLALEPLAAESTAANNKEKADEPIQVAMPRLSITSDADEDGDEADEQHYLCSARTHISEWTAASVEKWLRSIKMDHYVDTFTRLFGENRITGYHLLAIDADILEKTFGVTSKGDCETLMAELHKVRESVDSLTVFAFENLDEESRKHARCLEASLNSETQQGNLVVEAGGESFALCNVRDLLNVVDLETRIVRAYPPALKKKFHCEYRSPDGDIIKIFSSLHLLVLKQLSAHYKEKTIKLGLTVEK